MENNQTVGEILISKFNELYDYLFSLVPFNVSINTQKPDINKLIIAIEFMRINKDKIPLYIDQLLEKYQITRTNEVIVRINNYIESFFLLVNEIENVD